MKPGRSKGKYAKEHKTLRGDLDAHKRHAILGKYARVGEEALRIVALGKYLAELKKDIITCAHPNAVEEYRDRAALFGGWMADAFSTDGWANLLESIASLIRENPPGLQFVEAPEQSVSKEEFLKMAADESGSRAVKFEYGLKRLLSEKPFGVQMNIDPVRVSIAYAASMTLRRHPNHLFSIDELLSWCGRTKVSDKTVRRIAHEFCLPLIGPGAPVGKKRRKR